MGQTELVANNQNPVYVKEIIVDYFFEMHQNMLLEVYNADNADKINNLQAQQKIGEYKFTLGNICARTNQVVKGMIDSDIRDEAGEVSIVAE